MTGSGLKFLLKWLVYTISLFIVSHVVAGVSIENWQSTVIAALVLGLVNTFIKPFLIALTLPINILSMGVLTLFINGFMFYLASRFVAGFTVSGFSSAFWAALLFSIVSFFVNLLLAPNTGIHYRGFKAAGRSQDGASRVDNDTYDLPRTDWRSSVSCPGCGSGDTRFVEPHHEASVYECNICRRRFETEDD